jgi:hypothetical protein
MKSLEGVLCLSILALALLASACEPVSVAPWPYTTATDDASAPGDGAVDDGASDRDASGPTGIQATYGSVPLRCDGGLCNTDNYSLCNIGDRPAGSGAGVPLSVLAFVAGMAIARSRHRRKARRSS